MGTKTSLATAILAAAHTVAAWNNGRNASAFIVQAQEHAQELITLLKECIRDMPTGQLTAGGTISASSPTITMAQPLPSWVSPGQSVFDQTKNAALGTVLTASGTTLTLSANSLSAGSGSADILLIADTNIVAFNTLITNLS
jgi:hypothetical protein